jgi:hypothetical protein
LYFPPGKGVLPQIRSVSLLTSGPRRSTMAQKGESGDRRPSLNLQDHHGDRSHPL